tara:strand:+ start:2804 stop:3085 length:282 start_codon:yes stop_codon:yes gene_type:complete
MILSEIKLNKRDNFYYVINEYGPIGTMYDFYTGAKKLTSSLSRYPYPFSSRKNKFENYEEAQVAMQKTKDHVQAVLALPEKQKIGSSKHWKEN